MGSIEQITADVCVVGGGPAGTTTAQQIASLGFDVCLIEREAFPKPRIGASLPSSILPLLEVIGVRDRVENAGFLRPERIVVWWSTPDPVIGPSPGPPGFHVARDELDELLVRNAEARGVLVLRPARATLPQRRADGGWQVKFHHAGNLKEVIASFIVDATGTRPLLPGRRVRVSAPLLSLYAHWQSVDRKETEGRVEAGENEWLWWAPLGGGKSVAAVFLDPKRLSGMRRVEIDSLYRDLLRGFKLFREDQAGRIRGGVKACDASSRYTAPAAGPDFVRIGDANLTLDPMSSQGVLNAIASGIQAAVVINTLARHSAHAKDAIDFFQARQMERVLQYAGKSAAFYQERAAVCDRPFWRQRAASAKMASTPVLESKKLEAGCKIELSKLATIENMPTIQGDRIASAPVVRHEALERPVAFLHDVQLAPLLRQIRSGQTADSIVECWSRQMAPDLSRQILSWLWHRKIVVPVTSFP
jgi:flavin-dependent dehydrogenase